MLHTHCALIFLIISMNFQIHSTTPATGVKTLTQMAKVLWLTPTRPCAVITTSVGEWTDLQQLTGH